MAQRFRRSVLPLYKSNPPYKCEGFWRGQQIEFEWVPRQWLTLYMQVYDENVVESFSGVMRLGPALQYTMTGSSNGQPAEEEEASEPTADAEPAETTSADAADTEAESAEAAPGSQEERFVVEWRVRDVEERLRKLMQQAGVRDVRQM